MIYSLMEYLGDSDVYKTWESVLLVNWNVGYCVYSIIILNMFMILFKFIVIKNSVWD